MANIYKSNYTGAKVDEAIEKVLNAAPEASDELQKKIISLSDICDVVPMWIELNGFTVTKTEIMTLSDGKEYMGFKFSNLTSIPTNLPINQCSFCIEYSSVKIPIYIVYSSTVSPTDITNTVFCVLNDNNYLAYSLKTSPTGSINIPACGPSGYNWLAVGLKPELFNDTLVTILNN